MRVGGELVALGAGGVGGEVEAALVRAVQEQRADVGQALGVHRGQGHRVRLGLPGGHGLGEPGVEEGERGGRGRLRIEGGQLGVPDALGVQEVVEGGGEDGLRVDAHQAIGPHGVGERCVAR
ncbi:hypothetical protein SCALM49S_07698 [Streptomyces californicus]